MYETKKNLKKHKKNYFYVINNENGIVGNYSINQQRTCMKSTRIRNFTSYKK